MLFRAVIAPAKLPFDYRRRSRGTFAAQFGRRPSLSKLFWPFGGLVRVLKGSRRRSNDLVDQVVGNFRPSESSFSLVAFCSPLLLGAFALPRPRRWNSNVVARSNLYESICRLG
ncbi:hypothetical protein K0M31_007275 [Melipona bicolor]|uniref:Uncharacterized protein n=1 Tax=Melipona bicolor TaxID=60889 RepID=A0AA40GBD8_9HYME|nr:hypothetical protein K0M31_007275 [Melipona bicolor]